MLLLIDNINVIDSFRGKYFFLSNFFLKPVYYKSEWYKSSEHAFQAQKATNRKDKQYVQNAKSAAQAKRRGKEIMCRKRWNEIKMMVMYEILLCKFTDGILADKLLDTKDDLLVEGNSWGDKYWGMVKDPKTGDWKGDNFLGKLLMKVRNEIR
jgi:ribA/ribD-fused uncharacterized protein